MPSARHQQHRQQRDDQRDAALAGVRLDDDCEVLISCPHRPRFMFRGATSKRTSWSGTKRSPPCDRPPWRNSTPGWPAQHVVGHLHAQGDPHLPHAQQVGVVLVWHVGAVRCWLPPGTRDRRSASPPAAHRGRRARSRGSESADAPPAGPVPSTWNTQFSPALQCPCCCPCRLPAASDRRSSKDPGDRSTRLDQLRRQRIAEELDAEIDDVVDDGQIGLLAVVVPELVQVRAGARSGSRCATRPA